MNTYTEEKRYFLHLLTIVVIMIIFSIILMIGDRKTYVVTLILSFLIELIMARKYLIKSLISYFLLFCIVYLMNKYMMSHISGALYTMLLIILKLCPIWILAKVLSSHTSSELMNAFRKVHFSQKITISIAVFFRFVPEFITRLKEIKEGAKIRGLGFSILHPVKSFEIFVVPLMYKALSISDTLTCSIITKGIEYPCKKTCYRTMNFTYRDVLFIFLSLGILGGAIWTRL